MSESLWSEPADALLQRVASTEPIPGSGAAAAVAGAMGIALVLKALAITDDDGCAALRTRGAALLERVVASADRDAAAFAAVVAARSAEGGGDSGREASSDGDGGGQDNVGGSGGDGSGGEDNGDGSDDGDARVVEATVAAAEVPLELAAALIAGVALAREAEPLVKPALTSDALAGADLARAAATTALRAAALNIASLEERGAADAPALRERLAELERQLAARRADA